MVIIAFRKFCVKGRHEDFPFASPSAQNGSAWPDDCPKKNSKRVPAIFGCVLAAEMLHQRMSYCLVHICVQRNLLVKSSIAWIRQWSKSELTLYFCSGEAPCTSYHGVPQYGDMSFELILLIAPGLPIFGGKILAAIDLPSINELLNITVSKYSQHCSSCWAQCVFLVKLTCQG